MEIVEYESNKLKSQMVVIGPALLVLVEAIDKAKYLLQYK